MSVHNFLAVLSLWNSLVRETGIQIDGKSHDIETNPAMAEEPPTKRKCRSPDCENDAGTLQCPTCLKLGIKDSIFCSQDCFKKNWVSLFVGRHNLAPHFCLG